LQVVWELESDRWNVSGLLMHKNDRLRRCKLCCHIFAILLSLGELNRLENTRNVVKLHLSYFLTIISLMYRLETMHTVQFQYASLFCICKNFYLKLFVQEMQVVITAVRVEWLRELYYTVSQKTRHHTLVCKFAKC